MRATIVIVSLFVASNSHWFYMGVHAYGTEHHVHEHSHDGHVHTHAHEHDHDPDLHGTDNQHASCEEHDHTHPDAVIVIAGPNNTNRRIEHTVPLSTATNRVSLNDCQTPTLETYFHTTPSHDTLQQLQSIIMLT